MSSRSKSELFVQNPVISIEKHSTPKANLLKKKQSKTEKNDKISKHKTILKKFLTFMISHFGMLFLVIGYIFIGAVLFQTIEQSNEIQNCETAKSSQTQTISEYTIKLFNYINYNISIDPLANMTGVSRNDYNLQIDDYILQIRNIIIQNYQLYKYSGQLDCENTSMWQLESAVCKYL